MNHAALAQGHAAAPRALSLFFSLSNLSASRFIFLPGTKPWRPRPPLPRLVGALPAQPLPRPSAQAQSPQTPIHAVSSRTSPEGASPPHPWSHPCRIRVLAMPLVRPSFLTRPRVPSSPCSSAAAAGLVSLRGRRAPRSMTSASSSPAPPSRFLARFSSPPSPAPPR